TAEPSNRAANAPMLQDQLEAFAGVGAFLERDLDDAVEILAAIETIDRGRDRTPLADRLEIRPRVHDIAVRQAQLAGIASSIAARGFIPSALFGSKMGNGFRLDQRQPEPVTHSQNAGVEQDAKVAGLAGIVDQQVEHGFGAIGSKRFLNLSEIHLLGTIFPNFGISTLLVYSSCCFRSAIASCNFICLTIATICAAPCLPHSSRSAAVAGNAGSLPPPCAITS